MGGGGHLGGTRKVNAFFINNRQLTFEVGGGLNLLISGSEGVGGAWMIGASRNKPVWVVEGSLE